MAQQNMDAYLEELYDSWQTEFPMPLGKKERWIPWRADLLRAVEQELKGFPQKYAPLDPKVESEEEMDGFTRTLVSFTSEANMRIPAYLLTPSDLDPSEKRPAVVAVAGHGAGMTEIVGIGDDGKDRPFGEGYQKDFAVSLVKKGFVVIVPEMLGFGSRRVDADRAMGPQRCSCYRISTNLLVMGKTMAGVRARDVSRAVDYLETLPFVDKDRIGSMGISGGGTTLMYAAARDGRLRANVLSCSGSTFRHSILAIEHCIDNFVPSLYRRAEMYDIIGLIAPRPLLLEAATEDEFFPPDGVEIAFDKLKKAYQTLGSPENVQIDWFEAGHSISGAQSYDFLWKHLNK